MKLPATVLSLRSALGLLALAASLHAAEPGSASIPLPYELTGTDAFGSTWTVYNGGRLMQQGESPMMSECLVPVVGARPLTAGGDGATLDGGDVVLAPVSVGVVSLVRRISTATDGSLRVFDTLKNTKSQEASVTLSYRTSINFGVQSARPITDPKRPEKVLGGIAIDGQGRACLILQSGPYGNVTITTSAARPNNAVNSAVALKVPAGKEVCLLSIVYPAPGPDAAERYARELKHGALLASVPPALRKLIINFTPGGAFPDVDLLRGDALDALELRGGDILRGTITADWKLTTPQGDITIPAERVLGMLTPPSARQRQLIATRDGELIGGTLASSTLRIELTSKQVMEVPLAQVARVGMRKSPADIDEPSREKPFLLFRSGDLRLFTPPTTPIEVATRFGRLRLDPQSIDTIDLQPEGAAAQLITLRDRSRFAGIVLADALEIQLQHTAAPAKLPLAALRKMQFRPSDDDAGATSAVTLIGGDTISGNLAGDLRVQTSYGILTAKAADIRRIQRVEGAADLQVTLWDNTTVRGDLLDTHLPLATQGAGALAMPLALVDSYTCAAPAAQSALAQQIQELVRKLDADDWKERENAEKELAAMGAPIAPALRQLRPSQSPEAQQRIDAILAKSDRK
jgi:hypothetical protein